MKFKKAWAKSDGQKFLKIVLDEGKEKWFNTNDAVFNYAKNNFKDGDDIGVEYSEKNGAYTANRINKEGKSTKGDGPTATKTSSDEAPKSDSGKPTCADCGKELKDNKYKKCYTCNQKNPVKSEGKYSSKSPDRENSIKTQSAYKIAALALHVFTGQIDDIATLKSKLDDLAEHLKDKF